MMGRAPEPDDLLMRLPPDDAEARRSREAFRGGDYAGKRWRDHDLKILGWREREMYAMKSTFITLAIEDGASPEIIEHRVTHRRSVARSTATTAARTGRRRAVRSPS